MAKVVVLSCGSVGSAVARHLASDDQVNDMLVVDLDADRAGALASELSVPMASVDVSDPARLAEVLDGADVVFNAVGPFHRFALAVVEGAIEAGVHYVDVNDDFDVAETLMTDGRYDAAARKAGVIVLSGIGSSPGLTNLLARWAVDELDTAETVDVVLGVPFIVNLGPTILEHMFHSMSGEVTQFIDGAYRRVPAGGDPRHFELLSPFDGPHRFGYFGHGEAITLPRFIPGIREATVRFSWFDEEGNRIYRTLDDLGLMDPECVGRLSLSPRRFLSEYMATPAGETAMGVSTDQRYNGAVFHAEASGHRGGIPTTVALELHYSMTPEDAAPDPSLSSGNDDITPLPAAMAVRKVLAGEVTQRGVLAPEACIDPIPFVSACCERLGARLYRRIVQTHEIALGSP